MPRRGGVKAKGLSQMEKALRALERELGKATQQAAENAARFLVGKTRPQVPKLTGAASRSVRYSSSKAKAKVEVGGTEAPYYPWLDWGGATGRKKSVKRPFLREGRYLYPTMKKNRAEFGKILDESLEDAAKRAGLDVD